MVDQAKINSLEAQRAVLATELQEYREDFAILSDQELQVVRVMGVSQNSEYLTECLNASVKNLNSLADTYQIPSFSDLLDFTDSAPYAEKVREAAHDYSTSLEKTAGDIDTKKSEVAVKIKELNRQIQEIDMDIAAEYLFNSDYD